MHPSLHQGTISSVVPCPARPARACSPLVLRGSIIDSLGRHDLDAESCKTDIGELSGGEQADGCDAQIFEDLGAEPDLAPLPRACNLRAGRARLRNGMRGHAGRAVAQEDDHASTFLLKPLKRGVDRGPAAKDIADKIGAM